jgi:uncharacterized protein YacL
MNTPKSVIVTRVTYLLLCELLGVAVSLNFPYIIPVWLGLVVALIIGCFFVLIETTLQGFTLRGFSTATFGLGVGLMCAWLLTRVEIDSLLVGMFLDSSRFGDVDSESRSAAIRLSFNVALYASLGFLGSTLALRSNRDDFAFIIPFVRFRQEGSQGRPVVLDVDAVIDSRVINIAKAGFLGARLIIPRFVLLEIQNLAVSTSIIQKQRGLRGLDVLEQMQADPGTDVIIHESDAVTSEQSLPTRLMEVTKLLDARLLTNNENLAKVARLQGLSVLNLLELMDALNPSVVVGETIRLALVRPGKDDHQAVGFLGDGTMIVVNHAAALLNSTQSVRVISTLQTSNGLMVFAEIETNA